MNKKYMISLIVIVIVLVFVGTASAKVYQEDDLSTDPDTQYLYEMAHDTWNCIDYYVDDKTGLPYDNSEDRTYTGIDKIGLYIASVAVAKELGFISKDEAINKVNKTLNTLLSEDFKTWNGSCTPYESSNIRIPYTWYNMTTLDPLPPTDIDVCTIDLGNYYASLIIGRSAFPELNQSFSKLLDDVNWSLLYDYNENIFYGGYNTKTCNYSTWHCNYSASDSQTASFIGIATEAVPAKHWEILNRCFEEWHGYRYYVGRGCGLYNQLLPGIFLDQRQTLMGISAKNLTNGDIAHAKNISSPVWGWSASSSLPVDISDTIAITFYYKGTGSSNTLQFKSEDEDGSVFGKRLYNATNTSEWTPARINYSELEYYWGGDDNLDLKNITRISFAIESGERDGIPVGEGGNGTLSICNTTLINTSEVVGINFYGCWYPERDIGTSLSLSVDPDNKIINITYDLGIGNKWVQIAKNFRKYDYLGCDCLEDQIVTPHASVLALSYFHKEVIENLKKLEEMGVRDPILIDGENYSFGFRDAVNWKSGKVSGKYLILDQAMIFLSVANYLNGRAWHLFIEDSISKKGVSLIEDYQGSVIYFVEGEDWAEQYGGGLDPKPHASNRSCLGNGWGNNGDYAKYAVNLSKDAYCLLFKMRYSDKFDDNNNANHIRVYLDDKLKGELCTEDTGDWDIFQWSDKVDIGYIPAGEHELKIVSSNGGELNCVNLDCFKLFREKKYFDTDPGTYPSIMGTHIGTVTPVHDANVSKMYTYPCSGTGGHTEYVRIYGNGVDVNATWNGYQGAGDYHYIEFSEPFTLEANVTYNYTIKTGSYPQIHHNRTLIVPGGEITCSEFIDANGKGYDDWIPAIRLE